MLNFLRRSGILNCNFRNVKEAHKKVPDVQYLFNYQFRKALWVQHMAQQQAVPIYAKENA